MEYKTPEDRVREEAQQHLRSLRLPTLAFIVGLLGVGFGFLADALSWAPLALIAILLVVGAWAVVAAWVLARWGRFARNLFRRYDH